MTEERQVNIVQAPVSNVVWQNQDSLQTILANAVWVSQVGETLYLIFGEVLPPGPDQPDSTQLNILPVARIALNTQGVEAVVQTLQAVTKRHKESPVP